MMIEFGILLIASILIIYLCSKVGELEDRIVELEENNKWYIFGGENDESIDN